MKRRVEIDGLRAVAVLPVVLYHAGVKGIPGGFLGVDVFFVISGYLITSIIFREMASGSFSFARFYERRARRILPAQYLVMLTCIPFAYFWMLPEDLENFGQSLVATVFFSNNVLLYLTSGYWVMEAEFKPLIHTWSLGVEEQYYFVVPVLMLLLMRLRRVGVVPALAVIACVSFAYSFLLVGSNASFAFLMLLTRAWEMAAGALIAMCFPSKYVERHPIGSGLLAAVGLVAVISSYFVVNREMSHPAFVTLLPVLGSILVIGFASPDNLVGRLLSGRMVVLIGLTSYSSYLWHQPMFAFARIVSLEEPRLWVMLALAALTFVIAYVSWKYFEGPFRDQIKVRLKTFIPVFAVVSLVLAGVGAHWHLVAGYSQSVPEIALDADQPQMTYKQYNDSVTRFRLAEFSSEHDYNVLIVGNSFARDFVNAGLANNYFSNHNLVYQPVIAAPSVHHIMLKEGVGSLLLDADFIIFASGYDHRRAIDTLNTIKLISKVSSAKSIVLGNKNFGWNNNAVMLMPEDERYSFRAKVSDAVLAHEAEAQEIIPPAIYVSWFDVLMDWENRVPVFTPTRKFISQDRRHFTQHGAKYVGAMLFEHPLLEELK